MPRLPRIPTVLLALCVAGCNEPTGGEGSDHLVPLAVGNRWTYEVRFPVSAAVADTVVTAITARGMAEIDGETRTLFAEQTFLQGSAPGPDDPSWFYGNEPEGYFFYGGAVAGDTTLLRTPWFLVLDRGLIFGQRRIVYNYELGAWRELELVGRTIHQVALPCDTPLGERRCITFRYYLPPLGDDVANGDWHLVWVAPGVGVLRHDLFFDEALAEPKGTARLIEVMLR